MSTVSITDLINEKVTNTNVVNIVVDQLATKEVNRRAELIVKAIDVLKELKNKVQSINRDDIKTYKNGTLETSMSEGRFKEIESAKKKVEEFESAFNLAISSNKEEDYKKLMEKVNSSSSKSETKSKEE